MPAFRVFPFVRDLAEYKLAPKRNEMLVLADELYWVSLLLLFRHIAKCSRLPPGYFTLNGDKAPPAARDSSEVARP